MGHGVLKPTLHQTHPACGRLGAWVHGRMAAEAHGRMGAKGVYEGVNACKNGRMGQMCA